MSINRVSLYHLETLLWIDRLGTFSAAAERLNTTQPTVSARMRELEQRLGTALFRREGRAMSLTAAGRKLVRDCDPLLRDMQYALLGSGGYGERSWSFGQSISYTRPNGPEFRLSLGQDRDRLWMSDASFASADSYSRVTASLDLSSYLQKRFERSDLRLTLDYRKSLARSDMEMNLFDEMVERWVEGDRREGFLMSFGMKL